MAATDRARKLLVRTAFVTSTTIATLVGAQNLAMLDAQQFLPTDADTSQTMTTLSSADTSVADTTIAKASPSITILRQSGQQTSLPQQTITASSSIAGSVIQPPSAQISVPQTVVVQQPIRQRTRSSR